MKRFDQLTRLGQAGRLRAVAREALREYAIDARRVRLVSNQTNCTFRIDAADGRSYALRVSLPGVHPPAEIRSEVAWQEAIAIDTGIRVPRPVRTRAGDHMATAEAFGVPEPRHCAMFEWLRGRTLAEVATPGSFEQFGALAARLHRHGAKWTPPDWFSVRALDKLFPFYDPDMLDSPRSRRVLSPAAHRLIQEMRAAVEDEVARLYSTNETPGLVHGDLHWWNVKVHRGRLQVFDFEDLSYAFPIQDIAITFSFLIRDSRYRELLEAFITGYTTVRPWPEEYPGQLELLIVHRGIDMLNFVLGSDYTVDSEIMRRYVEDAEVHLPRLFETWRSRL